jgi:hypothetical protein
MANQETLLLNEEINGRPFFELDSKLTRGLNIEFRPSSVERVVPLAGLELENIKYNDLAKYNFTQDSGTVFKMYMGIKYALDHRLELSAKFALDQSHYADLLTLGPETYRLRRITISKAQLKIDYEIIRSKEWMLNTFLEGEVGFRKRFNNLVIDEINGVEFGIKPSFKLTPTFNVTSNLSYRFENSFMMNSLQQVEQFREKLNLSFGLEHLF